MGLGIDLIFNPNSLVQLAEIWPLAMIQIQNLFNQNLLSQGAHQLQIPAPGC